MTKTDQEPERCQKRIYGTRDVVGHVCGRPVKADGLCGIHLGARQRVAQNTAKWKASRDESEARRRTAADWLAAEGVPGHPDFSTLGGKYTGRVVVEIADLIAWKARP